MVQHEIHVNGSRMVVIVEDGKHVSARLYVNNGETATLTCWKGKTLKGAQQWAQKQVQAQ